MLDTRTITQIEASTDKAQMIAINVLIGLFAVLVTLLGIIFGVAIMFVCQAFAILRILIGYAISLLVQFQQQQRAGRASSQEESKETASGPRRPSSAFVARYGLYQPFAASS